MVRKRKDGPNQGRHGKGQGIVTIMRGTRPGALAGIEQVYYQNGYPVTAVVYGLFPIREPDQTIVAPMRVGRLNYVLQRVIEHFESTLRGQGLTDVRHQKM